MNYDQNNYPASTSTNSRALFNNLGYFWRRVFQDREAVQGLALSDSLSAEQAYLNILDLVNTYSAGNIPVYERRNWYPLVILESDLNNNYLLFGEGVKFGDQVSSSYYTFGEPIPEADGVYSILLPEELVQFEFMFDQIISPANTWAAGLDFKVAGRRLFFDGNPFDRSNMLITQVLDDSGAAIDRKITLWVPGASISQNYLNNSLGYLFGLNVPENTEGKKVIESVMSLTTGGPSINGIRGFCLSCLNVPTVSKDGTILSIEPSLDLSETVVTSSSGVYRYPSAYKLKSGVIVSSSVYAGDVLVDAVEFYDNVNHSEWWTSEHNANTFMPVNLPLVLPPYMMIGSYRGSLSFKNEVGLVTMDAHGDVSSFPVEGEPSDVKNYVKSLNNSIFISELNAYAGDTLSDINPLAINPVDFALRTYLSQSTCLLRLRFYSLSRLKMFSEYFRAVSKLLPKHVLLLIVCDTMIDNDVVELNSATSTTVEPTIPMFSHSINDVSDGIVCNTGTPLEGSLIVQDMLSIRTITDPISTSDMPGYSLVKPA